MMSVIFIGLAMLVFALVIYAFIDCVTRRRGWWPAWLLFILLGFLPVSLNLSTGRLEADPLSVLVLGFKLAKETQDGITHWILAFGIPVGALLWLRRSKGVVAASQSGLKRR